MCLLVTGKSNDIRNMFLNTPGMIDDVYRSNADGIGAMYASKDGLRVRKVLPKNADAARALISSLPNDDRLLALHWRMKTHGLINLDNCHPYTVSPGIALAHNGILDTGNKADTTKSDTWHFIQDYLKLLDADALHSEGVSTMIGDYIGDNRFAIMSADGRLTVINKDQGVEAKGVWFSNTYAWTPSMLGIKSKYSVKGYSTWSHFDRYDSKYDVIGGTVASHSRWSGLIDDEFSDDVDDVEVPPQRVTGMLDVSDDVDEAICDCDVETMAGVLATAPRSTLTYLYSAYDVRPYAKVFDSDLSNYYADTRDLLTAGDIDAIVARIRDTQGPGEEIVAETLMWYCDVVSKERVYANA